VTIVTAVAIATDVTIVSAVATKISVPKDYYSTKSGSNLKNKTFDCLYDFINIYQNITVTISTSHKYSNTRTCAQKYKQYMKLRQRIVSTFSFSLSGRSNSPEQTTSNREYPSARGIRWVLATSATISEAVFCAETFRKTILAHRLLKCKITLLLNIQVNKPKYDP